MASPRVGGTTIPFGSSTSPNGSRSSEVRDANDLALTVYWYAESKQVQDRLYDTTEGQEILVAEEADVPRAAARLLGRDVSALVGPERVAELVERWPGDLDMLVRNFRMRTGPQWLDHRPRRLEIIQALTRGLHARSEPDVAGDIPMT